MFGGLLRARDEKNGGNSLEGEVGNQPPEFESRIEELGRRLAAVERRLSHLEVLGPAGRAAAAGAPAAGSEVEGRKAVALDGFSSALLGRTFLVLAGAFGLRALTESGLFPQGIGEIMQRIGGVRAQPQRFPIGVDRVPELTLLLHGDAEVVMRVGESGIDAQRTPNEALGDDTLSHVLGQYTTKVQGVGIIGFGVDDLAIETLRIRQIARLVESEGATQLCLG